MDRVTQQNASLVQQSAAAASALEDQASRLSQPSPLRLRGIARQRPAQRPDGRAGECQPDARNGKSTGRCKPGQLGNVLNRLRSLTG